MRWREDVGQKTYVLLDGVKIPSVSSEIVDVSAEQIILQAQSGSAIDKIKEWYGEDVAIEATGDFVRASAGGIRVEGVLSEKAALALVFAKAIHTRLTGQNDLQTGYEPQTATPVLVA